MRIVSYLLCIAMLAGILGCAPVTPPKPSTQATPPGGGTILSMRTVTPVASVEPSLASLLSGGGGHDSGDRSRVEFIIRADDGAVLSIVQANDAGFRQGDRVIILRGDQTRLARPG